MSLCIIRNFRSTLGLKPFETVKCFLCIKKANFSLQCTSILNPRKDERVAELGKVNNLDGLLVFLSEICIIHNCISLKKYYLTKLHTSEIYDIASALEGLVTVYGCGSLLSQWKL